MKDPSKKHVISFSLSTEVVGKLEDIYIAHCVNKDKKSRSAIVAQAISDVWTQNDNYAKAAKPSDE